MSPFLNEWRLRWYPRAVLLALAIAFIGASVAPDSARGGWLGGDLPTFYGAGRLVLAGDFAHLYDWGSDARAQQGLYPAGDEGFIPFAYPPFVALAYAPFALLPYRIAWMLHTLALVSCAFVAARALERLLPNLRAWPDMTLAATLGFYPILRAVIGGQNTAASLAIALGAAALCEARRDIAAGAVLGLLLFKPQFAIPMICLYGVERRARVIGGAAAVGGVLYLLGAFVGGLGWPLWWWRAGVSKFHVVDQGLNAQNSVGWLGFCEAVFGVGSPLARGLGWALAAATAALLVAAWRRPCAGDRGERVALACVGSVLLAPHAMSYDAGLALPALFVAYERRPHLAPLLAVVWLLSGLHTFAPQLGFTPLFFVEVVLLVLVTLSWWRHRHHQRPRSDAARSSAPEST